VDAFFNLFNKGFAKFAAGYSALVTRVVRFAGMMLLVYAAVLFGGFLEFRQAPVGFIPQLDRGYIIVAAQLPSGAALDRTDKVLRQAVNIALDVPGVKGAVNFVGFSGATFSQASNAGAIFLVLEPFEDRAGDSRKSAPAIQAELFKRFAPIQDGLLIVVLPPPVAGIGNAGGFRMMVEDRAGRGPEALQQAVGAMMGKATTTPGLIQVFSLFETSTPQLYLDVDRTKAQLLGINIPDVFNALQTYLGSSYVNDFNLFGRTFRVTAQADSAFRLDTKDVLKIRVRNSSGDTVPIGAFTTASDRSGPFRVPRYNLYPAAELDGAAAPGYSQGQAIGIMEKMAAETLPDGFSFECCLRFPRAGRAIRKPHAAARGHSHRADVPCRRDYRRAHSRPGQQHSHPGRVYRADRSRRQERYSDCRIRQTARRAGAQSLRRCHRGGAAAAAADRDDLAVLRLRRDAAGMGGGRRRRDAPIAGHGGILRHDRRHHLRADLHAGVLRRVAKNR
jgi:hypothetical protein